MSADAQPAVSSTVEVSAPSRDIAAYMAEENAREMGTEVVQPSPAESAPAEPDDQAASTDASQPPASEPGKPAKSNAESRKAQLAAEIDDLLRKRAELRGEVEQGSKPTAVPDAKPAAPSPAPVDEEFPSFDAWAEQPENAGKPYEAYSRALVANELKVQQQAQVRQQEVAGRASAFRDRMTQAIQADPGFLQNLHPDLVGFVPVDALPPGSTPSVDNIIAQEIVNSEHGIALMRALSAQPALLQSLRSSDPWTVVRTLGRLEGQQASPSPVPAKEPSRVTKAPEPPTTLGSKPIAPVDASESAIGRRDIAAYIAAENAKEMAARG